MTSTNQAVPTSRVPTYLAEPFVKEWLNQNDNENKLSVGPLNQTLLFAGVKAVEDFKDVWTTDANGKMPPMLHLPDSAILVDFFEDFDLVMNELLLAAEVAALSSCPGHTDLDDVFEKQGFDFNELVRSAEVAALDGFGKHTDDQNEHEDCYVDFGELLLAAEVAAHSSNPEHTDLDDVVEKPSKQLLATEATTPLASHNELPVDDCSFEGFDDNLCEILLAAELAALEVHDEPPDFSEESIESLITKCNEILGPRLVRELLELTRAGPSPVDPDIIARVHEACDYLTQPNHNPLELAMADEWFRGIPIQSDKRELARLGTVANYIAEYDSQQARLANGVGLRPGEAKLGSLSFKNVATHIKTMLTKIPDHLVPTPIREAISRIFDRVGQDELPPPAELELARRLLKLSPERFELLEAIKAVCVFIMRHNRVTAGELAVVVLVHDFQARHLRAAGLELHRRHQADIEAGFIVDSPRKRSGLGLRRLWRRLFRTNVSPSDVRPSADTGAASTAPFCESESVVKPAESRACKFHLPWRKAAASTPTSTSDAASTGTNSNAGPSGQAQAASLNAPASTRRFRFPWQKKKKEGTPTGEASPEVAPAPVVRPAEAASREEPEDKEWLLREAGVWNAVWSRMMTAGDGLF